VLKGVKDKMISLYPFPAVENITTVGLNWLTNGDLSITSRIGTRNFAVEDEVSIEYKNGDLLIFIGKNYYNL
jgi:thiamine pyrophosphokinase